MCPVCWSVRVKHRVFKTPRYKCEKCGSEFPNKKRISHADRILFNRLKNYVCQDIKQSVGIGIEDTYLRKITVKTIKEGKSHAGNNNHG